MVLFISQPKVNDRPLVEVVNEYVELSEAFAKQFSEFDDIIVKMIESDLPVRIENLLESEFVVFAPGYSKDRDCIVEEKCAKVYGKKCFYYIDSISKFIASAPEDLNKFE